MVATHQYVRLYIIFQYDKSHLYLNCLEEGPVDGLNLFKLDDEILARELGVTKLLHRARILEGFFVNDLM